MIKNNQLHQTSIRKANKARIFNEFKNYGIAVFLLILFFILWQFATSSSFERLIPKPSTIVQTIIDKWPLLATNSKQTLFEAVVGFLIGTSTGILIAIGFVYSKKFAKSIYPFLVFLQCMPLMALMPLLVLWFGTGLASKVVLITLATFFPTVINVVQGLISLDKPTIEFMETLNASEMQIFWKARVPFSIPYLFTAMRVTVTTAILGAIISEWLWATKGLGAVIVLAMFNAQVEVLWASMALATIFSLLAFSLIVILEKLVIPWHISNQE
ncbi:MAG: ABC transporter permease [Anaerolineaceae bacterium]|jgi:NitT/TauT family transport system permease protein|nr:ABC transporter permease [Anaerolineaceae bacterium]